MQRVGQEKREWQKRANFSVVANLRDVVEKSDTASPDSTEERLRAKLKLSRATATRGGKGGERDRYNIVQETAMRSSAEEGR